MTDIDLKRLAVDREYWDSVAPEGSTHFWPFGRGVFYVRNEDGTLSIFDSKCKGGLGVAHSSKLKEPDMIPRPPKKAHEVEWDGTAFPIPVGAKCEVQMGSFWYPGTVIASTTEAAWFKADQNGEFWTIMNGLSIRPIRTKQQRLRDELAHLIDENYGNSGSGIADAILTRYNLEPKP